MSRDITTTADERAETLVASIEAIADLLASIGPGFPVEAPRLAPLIQMLAAEARAVHEMGTLIRAASYRQAPVNDDIFA
jgi:hypothetical protein